MAISVTIIIGTRPEAIKMAPVYLALKASEHFDAHILATAQHREMLDQTLSVFDIRPKYDLNLMKKDQTLVDTSANIMTSVYAALNEIKPDAVLVHGDTNTCFYSALAAFYNNIPIGHVEAGLRTYKPKIPMARGNEPPTY